MKPQGRLLLSRLDNYRKRKNSLQMLAVLVLFVASALLASISSFMLFSPLPYLLLLIPLGLFLLLIIRKPSLYEEAISAEERDITWKDRLSTAADISQKRNPKEVYSEELKGDYLTGIETALEAKNLNADREKKRFYASLGILAASFALSLSVLILAPRRLCFGMNALFAPGSLDLRIESVTGDTILERGTRFQAKARIVSPVGLRYVILEQTSNAKTTKSKVKIEDKLATADIRMDSDVKLRFSRLGRSSKEVYLGLNEPFEIKNVTFTVTPPGYTREKPVVFHDFNISALPGSMVDFEGEASSELNEAHLQNGDSSSRIQVSGKRFMASFRFTNSMNAAVVLEDRTGSRKEQRIYVNAKHDQVPLVDLFMPGKDAVLDKSMSLYLGAEALDDYGLDQAMLVMQATDGQMISIGRSRGKVEDTLYYKWDLSGLNLLPGDEISYYVEVSDNDAVSGPKWGRSKTYRLRLPGMDEVFSELTEYGNKTASGLSALGEQQKELGMELSRIESKLKQDKTMSPEERARLEEILEAQKNLMGSVDSIAQEARQFLEKLREGAISDPETLAKLSSLSKMLADMMPPELRSRLDELASALKNDPQKLAEELAKTGSLSRDLEGQLEQAMSVLERFLEEQKLADLSEKSDALARMEENLMKEAGKLSQEEAKARQEEIRKGLEELAKQAQELSEALREKGISDELKKLASQMAGENKNLCDKVSKSLSDSKMDRESAKKLSQNLKNASMQFGQMASNLKRSRQDELNREMAAAARELLLLSDEQEKLTGNLPAVPSLEAAAKAAELERALERAKENLYRLASLSFNVPRDAMQNLAEASRSEEEFKESLIEGRTPSAQSQALSAQSAIDRAAASLLNAYARSLGQQGASSTGLAEMLNALSQMSLAQLSINQQMGGLLPLPISGQMTAAQQAALGEILSQQAGLREQLEELSKGQGSNPGLSGMLEGIIEEMKRMEEDMSRFTGERELVDRGERVFRRLLDAKNVLRKKDETREREREIGSVWRNLSSPSMPLDAGEKNLWLKKEIIRIERSDYPEEYKRMARQYIESLMER